MFRPWVAMFAERAGWGRRAWTCSDAMSWAFFRRLTCIFNAMLSFERPLAEEVCVSMGTSSDSITHLLEAFFAETALDPC